MRATAFLLAISSIGCDAAVDVTGPPNGSDDCRTCTNPDLPECDGCLGSPGMPDPRATVSPRPPIRSP